MNGSVRRFVSPRKPGSLTFAGAERKATGKISVPSKIRLGLRNTFNIHSEIHFTADRVFICRRGSHLGIHIISAQ